MTNDPSTADLIQRHALALFARQGYEATSLARLAEAVGIRKPSLYNHIDSKQALFMVLVEKVEAAFFAEQDASLARTAHADVKTRLCTLVTDMSRFILVEDQGMFYKRYLLFPPESLASEVRAINARNERRIDTALITLHAQGREENVWPHLEARRFLDVFYCLMDGLFTERFIYSTKEYSRRIDSIWPIFWAGLTARA